MPSGNHKLVPLAQDRMQVRSVGVILLMPLVPIFFFFFILCLSCPCSEPQEADFCGSIIWAPLPCALLLELTNRWPGKPSEVGNEENSGCLFSSLLPPPPKLAEVLAELQPLPPLATLMSWLTFLQCQLSQGSANTIPTLAPSGLGAGMASH